MGLAALVVAAAALALAAAAVEAAAAQVGPQGLLPLQSHPAAAQCHQVRPAYLLLLQEQQLGP
jgi:hypothetical protein